MKIGLESTSNLMMQFLLFDYLTTDLLSFNFPSAVSVLQWEENNFNIGILV